MAITRCGRCLGKDVDKGGGQHNTGGQRQHQAHALLAALVGGDGGAGAEAAKDEDKRGSEDLDASEGDGHMSSNSEVTLYIIEFCNLGIRYRFYEKE